MFRIYEWTFSSTADLAVGALLIAAPQAVAQDGSSTATAS